MPQYTDKPYRPEHENFTVRVEPTKGYTYQVVRRNNDGEFVSSVTTLDSHGLDASSKKLARMLANSPQMLGILLDITKNHSNNLPSSLLDWTAQIIDDIYQTEASHA